MGKRCADQVAAGGDAFLVALRFGDGSELGAKRGVPIVIQRVSKTFGEDTDKPFLALKQVSVDVAAG